MPRNLWILIAMQAFSFTAPPMVILIGGLIGSNLAPNPGLATLPVATLVLSTALSTVPASLIMRRLGRRAGFQIGNAVAVFSALVAALAVHNQSFLGLLVATGGLGFNMAFVNQYRFAAMESVDASHQGQSVSYLLLGGIFAAFVGPEVGALGEQLLTARYAGSFVLLAGLQLVVTGLLLFGFRDTVVPQTTAEGSGRDWRGLLSQPVLWLALLAGAVSYSVMSLVMTAAPVSMHDLDQHSLAMTKTAIQAHILAMFVPSLATGWLIHRFGAMRLLVSGLCLYAGVIALGISGRSFGHYSVSLILLGIGWNFLFVAGTTLLPRCYEGTERFRVQALNDVVVFGSQAIASLGAGWLLYQIGWDRLLWLTLVPMLVLGAVTLWNRRPAPGRTGPAEG